MKRPLATAGMTAMIALAVVFMLDKEISVCVLLVAFSMSVLFHHSRIGSYFMCITITWLIFTGAGISYGYKLSRTMDYSDTSITVFGEVVSSTESYSGQSKIILKIDEVDGRKTEFPFVAQLYGDMMDVGSRLRAEVDMEHISSGDSGRFSYLFSKGISYVGNIERVIEVSPPNISLLGIISGFSRQMRRSLDTYLSGPSQEMASAMVLGDRVYMSDEISLVFEKSGLSHVLAVSGLHVSIITMMVVWLLEKMKMNKRMASIGAFALMWIFIAMVGFRPSALRAGIMTSAFLVSNMFRVSSETLNSLGGACLVICFISPYIIFDVGFLLSVLATAGILSVGKELMYISHKRHPKPSKLWDSLMVSTGAMCYTLPVLAVLYGGIYPVVFLSNMIVLPVFSIFLAMSIITGILGVIPFTSPLAQIFGIATICVGDMTVGFICTVILPFSNFMAIPVWICIAAAVISFIIWMAWE